MKRCVSIILLCLLVVGVRAESALTHFRHITTEERLSSNHVRSILQDSQGFIWIGTDRGLDRYDGINFNNYSLPPQYEGTTLLAMLEDGDRIWIGSDRGVFVFDRSKEMISFVDTFLSQEGEISITSRISNITRDKEGNIWISTFGAGAYCYNINTEMVEKYSFPPVSDRLSAVFIDSTNQIWALSNWGEYMLFRLNKTTDEFEPFTLYSSNREFNPGGLVVIEDCEKRMWIGTWEEGVLEIDRVTGRVTRHLNPELGGAEINHIHSIMEYDMNLLLIGSDDGLVMYDVKKKKSWSISEGSWEDGGLSDRFVYPMTKDKEGGLWIGTYYGGINYYSPFSSQFNSYTHDSDDKNSVSGNVVGRFCEGPDRSIWIATDDGGLSRYNILDGSFENYRHIPGKNSLSFDNVHALCMDGTDLWIGTYSGGVNVLDTKTGRFRHYTSSPDPSSLDDASSYAIHKSRDGRIWVSTMSGINVYDRENDFFILVRKTPYRVIDIDEDTDGNMWFSTLGGGILRHDVKNHDWKTYKFTGESGHLPSDYVNCGMVDSKGNLWFGTTNGLCRYDAGSDGFYVIPMTKSLSNIRGVVEDNQVFWITTGSGLIRYDQQGKMQVFTRENGLNSNQFVANSIFKASDGRIYLGTGNGFNAFYPYQISLNNTLPEVAIVSTVIDNSILPVNGQKKIDIYHKDNAFTMHFVSLSFSASNKNQYAYMLEGFDKDWNYVGNKSSATYMNLPAGNYTFMVKGTNNNALWSEYPATMEIEVHPHPLLSTPFKILYLLLILLLPYLALRFIIKVNNRKHDVAMEELKDKKEKEVYEAKIKFFTMIAHEIRTPVSLIIAPLEMLLKKSEKLSDAVRKDLLMVEKNSQRLLYLVNQLLDLRKVEQNMMEMKFRKQAVSPLLKSVSERFESTINHKGCSLTVEYPVYDFEVSVDAEAVTKLLSNLLTNASKYAKDAIKLSCGLCQDDESFFQISVYDNGTGISPEEQNKIFLPFYQGADNKPGTGLGLSLVRSIAELHGGGVSVRSEQGIYTEFIVRLPIMHEMHEQPESRLDIIDVESVENSLEDVFNMEVIEMKPESKPLILIADDNEDIALFLSDVLLRQYDTIVATDGIQAMEQLKNNPDVAFIIADWVMPGMDGVELCKRVRENFQTSHIPFILLTAKTDDASKVMGMDYGVDAYIEKPFSVQYLEACIKNIMVMRNLLRQRYSSAPLTTLTSVANNSVDNRFLQTLSDFIDANLSDSNLSVDSLTEQMGISRSSFYNKIKVLTNKTPNELIQLMRLKKAAQLLLENKYRINEVCYMVGFNNPSYFSKCFFKQFGVKPGEFAAKAAK